MSVAAQYGIKDIDSLFKSMILIQLRTGEVIVSHGLPSEKGVITFLPMKLIDKDEGMILVPFLPYVKDRFFYLDYQDIQVLKTNLHDFISDSYKKMVSTMYKNEISSLIYESSEEDYIEASKQSNSEPIPEGVTMH